MPPKGRGAKDFKNKDLIEHIRDVPDTYVGSIEPKMIPEWIFNQEDEKMHLVDMDLPAGVKRVFLEILSNAGDNVRYSFSEGVPPGQIDFTYDKDGYLSIKNGGVPIPVEPHTKATKDNLYLVPTDIFSVPLSSTNYDETKDRLGAGRNGYGSKLTNCYSTHFLVTIGDNGRIDEDGNAITGQEYFGEWKDQMKELVTAKATPGFTLEKGEWNRIKRGAYKGPSYTEVSWRLDFSKMGMPAGNYSDNDIGLFCRYVLEFSLTCGVPVTINQKLYDFRSIRKFASLFYSEEKIKTAVSYFFPSKGSSPPSAFSRAKTSQQREEIVASGEYEPESQVLLLDTPDDGHIFSFVNGLLTAEGGVHVDKLFKELSPLLIKAVQDKAKSSESNLLKPKDVKPHLTIFLVCRVVNTKYNSQSKTKLESPTPNMSFTIDDVKPLISQSWVLIDRLLNAINAKNIKNLSKHDGKNIPHIKPKKGVDANYAGKKGKSSQCRLYIVEGKSAEPYPLKRIQEEEGGRDYGGVYPIQGKILNVSTHKDDQIVECTEIIGIVDYLGLRYGMDYSSNDTMKTLRYGECILVVDADSDGMHILGLMMNLFHRCWPTLLDRGFVKYLVTPVVRVFFGPKDKNKILCFYDEKSFDTWNQQNTRPTDCIKYYKGLGSSSDDDIKADVKTAPIVILDYDAEGKSLLDRAFLESSDGRKLWIEKWRESQHSVESFVPASILVHRAVSDVMSVSFPPYMINSIFRSIPSYKDGLKKSQRQIMYTMLHEYKYGSIFKEGEQKGIKTALASSKTAEFIHYHHGEASLWEAIVKMNQSYVGSNNMALFRSHSQFGTRDKGGEDRSEPRYTCFSNNWWMKYLYNKELIDLVPRRNVEGELGEPIWLPCDIHFGVINGVRGVGTGWNTFIPSHHPIQVVDWIVDKLSGKITRPLIPFFNGFKGAVSIKTKLPSKKEPAPEPESSFPSLEEDEDDRVLSTYTGRGMTTYGRFQVLNKNSDGTVDVEITELPIQLWSEKYRKWILEMVTNGKIKDFRDLSTTENPHFIINGLPAHMASFKKLFLEKSFGMSNMVQIDDDGVPTAHKSVENILALYVEEMLQLYKLLKDSQLKNIQDKIKAKNMEMAIIRAYLDGKLVIKTGTTDEEIDEQLLSQKLSKEIFDRIGLRKLTQTRIDMLNKSIQEDEKEYDTLAAMPVNSIWKNRLLAFRKEFLRRKIMKESVEEEFTISSDITGKMLGYDIYKQVEANYSG